MVQTRIRVRTDNQRQWKNKDSSQEVNARESSGLNTAAGEE